MHPSRMRATLLRGIRRGIRILFGRQLTQRQLELAKHGRESQNERTRHPSSGLSRLVLVKKRVTYTTQDGNPVKIIHKQSQSYSGSAQPGSGLSQNNYERRTYTPDGRLSHREIHYSSDFGSTQSEIEYNPPGRLKGKRKK